MSKAESNALVVSYDVLGTHVELDLDFVKKYLVRGRAELVSNQEIVFFMSTCRQQKLNPLVQGEVYLIKYSKDDPAQMVVGKEAFPAGAYSGAVNCKTLIQDTADQMGVTVSFSYNAEFKDIPNGYSYVGPARNVLTKACETSGLVWSINNGVLQVKKPGDTMSREVYELSAETGLLGLPERVQISNEDKGYSYGWDVEYLMNAAIGLDDYVYLNSKMVKGYFRVYSVRIEGDNMEGSWSCTARLLEVKQK